jgi:hypothetical protein
MTQTLRFDLTTAWTEVASNSPDVLIQRLSVEDVRVHVGASMPDAGAPALLLGGGAGPAVHLTFLSAGDRVFAAGANGPAAVVVVMA